MTFIDTSTKMEKMDSGNYLITGSRRAIFNTAIDLVIAISKYFWLCDYSRTTILKRFEQFLKNKCS